jgi:hypothetical protein
MNMKKIVKKKARGVTMKARIAALDRAALVQRLQNSGAAIRNWAFGNVTGQFRSAN